jgi:hypothetical protein
MNKIQVGLLAAVAVLVSGMSEASAGGGGLTLDQLTQEAPALSPSESGAAPETPSSQQQQQMQADAKIVPKVGGSMYVSPSLENFSKTLWLFDAHTLDNSEAVDNYLKITECKLYSRFHGNEFEWRKIREAARKYLGEYKAQFPRYYEYVQPLRLERYDFSLKGFPIANEQQFNSATRLQIMGASDGVNKCGELVGKIDGYPNSIVLTTKQPFNLTFIRVPEELAKEYLRMLEGKKVDTRHNRPAYVFFRVRLDQFLETGEESNIYFTNYGGEIEKIEVFADRAMMYPLYEQSFD